MAFHLALTVLCIAAVCSSSLASPALYRFQRAAEPPAASSFAKQQQIAAQQVAQAKFIQPQPKAVVFQNVQPQPKAVVFQNVQPQPVYQVAQFSQPAPVGYQVSQNSQSALADYQVAQISQPAPAGYQVAQISQPAPVGYQAVEVSAAPAQISATKSIAAVSYDNVPNQQAQITGQSYEFNPADNSFAYSFQTNNGISQQAKGYFNQNGKYVQEGSYTLYTPEGVPVSISYIADENGYQAFGDAIPQPDPVIAKAIAYQRSLPPSAAEDNGAKV